MKYNFSDNFDIYEIHYQTEETKKMLNDINKLTNFKNIRTNNQKVLNYLNNFDNCVRTHFNFVYV